MFFFNSIQFLGFNIPNSIINSMRNLIFLTETFLGISTYLSFLKEPVIEGSGVDIKEPLDTIFVKSVKESGPAHLAGLQCGKLQKLEIKGENN